MQLAALVPVSLSLCIQILPPSRQILDGCRGVKRLGCRRVRQPHYELDSV